MARFVYADNAATTPISDAVFEAMKPHLTAQYGNPSSLYRIGRQAKRDINHARQQVATALGAPDASTILLTGGGSQADNLAITGFMKGATARGRRHIITSAIEHHAVLYTCEALEKEGFTVTYLPVDDKGMIRLCDLEAAISQDTALVTIMAANNEIGTLQPIREIAKIVHAHGAVFHTDAVQAVGHMAIDVVDMGIDMLSLSAHKMRGPKGIGALYVRKGIALQPLVHGGGQEKGLVSGTENVAAMVGLGVAIERACGEEQAKTLAYVQSLRDRLIAGIMKIPYTHYTGHPEQRLPGTASFVFEAIEGEGLILRLDFAGVCASTGSACSTGSLDPSHVLMAIGLPHEIAHGSLRLTLGEQNTVEDVDYLIETVSKVVSDLREMSPVWANGAPDMTSACNLHSDHHHH